MIKPRFQIGDKVILKPGCAWHMAEEEGAVRTVHRVKVTDAYELISFDELIAAHPTHSYRADRYYLAPLQINVQSQGESDPNGLSPSAPGAKLDAGKLKPTLIFKDMANALVAVIKIATDGAAKYSPGGWLEVPEGQSRYDDADLRHMLKRYTGQGIDNQSKSLHLAHEAWNALAKLELFLRENPEHKVEQ